MPMPADPHRAPQPSQAIAAQPRRGLLRRFAPLAVILAAMALVLLSGLHRELSLETLVSHRAAIEDFVARHYVAALAGFVALYIAAVAMSLPGAVFLTIASGVLFGAAIGGLASIAGATVGASLIFLIARSAFGETLVRRAGPFAERFADGFRSDAFNYLLFLRLVPLFPFWLVNLAPALFGIRLATFVGATALGVIPGTFAFAFFGAGLDSVIAAQEAAYKACLAAGGNACRLDFSLGKALTPQLLAAFAALGAAALIPVAVKRLRSRSARPAG